MRFLLFINNKCNMNCNYCYDVRKRDNTEMSKKTMLSVINYAKQYNENIVFTLAGGEPSLSPELIEFAIKNSPPNFKLQTMTNGYNFSDKFLDVIINNKDRICVYLSFDGLHQEERKQNSTDKVLKNIELLKQHNVELILGLTLHVNSVNCFYDNLRYINKFHNYIKIKRECLSGNKWGKDFYESFKNEIDKVVDYTSFMETCYGFGYDLPNHIQKGSADSHPNRKGNISCINHVIHDAVIGMDGTIYPCELYAAEEWGSVGHVNSGCDKSKYNNINYKNPLKDFEYDCVFLHEKLNNDINDNANCVCYEVDRLLEEKRAKYANRVKKLSRLKNK